MNEERKVLGILAIIFGAIALFGSWMPIINNLSFVIAILALILGLIGLAINRKRPKNVGYHWYSFSSRINDYCYRYAIDVCPCFEQRC